MKRLLFVFLSLMLSFTAFSQTTVYFKNFSETERSNHININTTNGNNYIEFVTLEDLLQEFTRRFGGECLQNAVNAIENGTFERFKAAMIAKGLCPNDKDSNIVNWVNYYVNHRMSFVQNGKIYILTYEPITDDNIKNYKNAVDYCGGDIPYKKNLFLYRRDADGWKKASGLIRVDYYFERVKMQEFVNRANSKYMGSVNKDLSGNVFMTIGTTMWTPETETKTHFSMLVFVPTGDENYDFTLLEPVIKWGYDAFPLYATMDIRKDGISYAHGGKTMNIKIVDSQITHDGNIELK